MHCENPFRRGETQVLDQERQVDAKLPGGLDAASRSRMTQPLFRPFKFARSQSTPTPHIH
jgi:hypothetical protein